MKETRADRADQDGVSSYGIPPAGMAELLDACVGNAEQLIEVLKEEAAILKRFDHLELMALVPQKERLVGELGDKLSTLKALRGFNDGADPGSQCGFLKLCLDEIRKANDNNRLFIEGSLKIYRDLLECVRPSSYGPFRETQSQQEMSSFKGLTFRKEI